MSVLFISYKYPPEVGGMQKQSFELITGFQKRGRCHTLIKHHHCPVIIFFLSLLFRIPFTIIRNRDIKLIHCNDGVCALLCAWVKLFFNVKMAVTYHGLDLVFPSKIYQKILLKLVHGFDLIICVSEFTSSQCIDKGFNKEKVVVIPNGINPQLDYNAENVNPETILLFEHLKENKKKILISIGRPVTRKGFSWFIKMVLSRLDDTYHYIIIGQYNLQRKTQWYRFLPAFITSKIDLFFGTPTDVKPLLTLENDEEFKTRFTWLKSLNYDSLLFALQEADLFVMPNIEVKGDAEGFGLVALESALSKTNVLAADLEGISSAIINEKNGSLIQSDHSDLWVHNIKSHFDLPFNQRSLMASKAQRFTQSSFSWASMIDSYQSLFSQVVNPRALTKSIL